MDNLKMLTRLTTALALTALISWILSECITYQNAGALDHLLFLLSVASGLMTFLSFTAFLLVILIREYKK